MTYNAIGFDLDETLIVSSTPRSEILSMISDVHDIQELRREDYIQAHRNCNLKKDRIPIFEQLLSDNRSNADAEAIAKMYRRLVTESIESISGVPKMLNELQSEYKLGLLTNGPYRAQRSKLEKFDWTEVFDTILIEGEIGVGKPHKLAFETLSESLEAGNALIYVGNEIETDIIGASEAGLDVIQVGGPDQPEPHPRADGYIRQDELASTLQPTIEAL